MSTNLVMFLISIATLLVGSGGTWLLTKKSKDPKAILATADTVIDEVKTANDTFGKLLPAPVESIVDLVIKAAQAGVHGAQQLCNSDQLTQDERNGKAFDAAMNLLKVGGYEPTPELETAVKDMIETGVFVMKSIDKSSIARTDASVPLDSSQSVPDPASAVMVADPSTPAQSDAAASPQPTVQEAVTQAIRQTVQPVAQQTADQTVQDIIAEAVQSGVKQIQTSV
ncbi:hypothetical protein [Desulfosporosinus sp. OT]|uniref:hypothetical protein n=1 Tax=Desulfosporosinus sp. OT TaxID=913865 RepID=UPI000223A4FF|nr:hypothetical protein [Desulfosporosinus sp. OT]EGW36423.1 hypothetical protein DOT_5676 [Desulfosporosinus sp. OT]